MKKNIEKKKITVCQQSCYRVVIFSSDRPRKLLKDSGVIGLLFDIYRVTPTPKKTKTKKKTKNKTKKKTEPINFFINSTKIKQNNSNFVHSNF